MCLWNLDAPGGHKNSKYDKNLQVLHFDSARPQGHVISVKCEEPIDELTAKFGYCMTTQTLNIALYL